MCLSVSSIDKKRFLSSKIRAVLICLLYTNLLPAQVGTEYGNEDPDHIISHWSFDNDKPGYVTDIAQNINYSLFGNAVYVRGVQGKGIKLDGFRTFIKHNGSGFKNIPDSFTVETWIAPAFYPWSSCPVIDCSDEKKRGFSFGIDQLGRVNFSIAAGSRWYEVISDKTIQLRKWSHLAGIFRADSIINIFINGEKVASCPVEGNFIPSDYGPVIIGRNNEPVVWDEYQLTSPDTYFYLDAIVDEILLTGRAKDLSEIRNFLAKIDYSEEPELTIRGDFPVGPDGTGSFGAFYTRLDYYSEWDELWRVGDKPDVFVRFDSSPVQLVFWRGTSFVPCWVSENNIWYTNEWLETWGSDVVSCAEPIMDRHCRYSHVRIIENTDARVIVHWRYALSDAFYKVVAITDDGRGEWCDEYHIIYPDNVGVRRMELHYSKPERKHDWVEQIVLTPPGKYPDDIISREAITLINMNGEKKNYLWRDNIKVEMKEPEKANISRVNLISEYKPFIILPEGPVNTVEGIWDSPYFRTYAAAMAEGYRPDPVPSVYGWWNHWPVAQVPGDGRWILTPDRPGHFNLTTFVQWNDYAKTERTRTRIMLQGMTNTDSDDLVYLARSWLNAPEMVVNNREDNINSAFDQAQRAYVIEKSTGDFEYPIQLTLEATNTSPLVNPAIIVKNWNKEEAEVSLNGRQIKNKKDLRQGIIKGADSSDLILWIRIRTEKKLQIVIY